ncbi:MAG: cation:proton antiporter [Holosporaceae bacterium]|jgi:CPA2 family monovalent cation:H+ antiporter-2|nr:cation:proton antiporter [Holosporaceae bacterium]
MDWTITKIASVVLCAMGSGLVFSTLGHAPVLGYIIAGVLLGPSGLKLIIDRETVEVFSEMGILFLLFVIGLGLSFEKIKNIWKTSVASTLLSTVLIYVIVLVMGYILKISHKHVLLITFCITLSSTAVTVKSLGRLKDRDSAIEENTFGILIAQDLIALVMVLIVNFLGESSAQENDNHVYRIVALLLFVAGLIFYFLWYHKHIHKFTSFIQKHGEMLTLIVFGLCLGGAVCAEIAGLSAPFGAFIMGLILGNSNIREKAKEVAAPIEELLLMTFFLSVGLLVDLKFVFNNVWLITAALLFVTFGKTIINIFVLRFCKFPLKESFVISVLLGHIGEFSFMLSYAGIKVGLIDDYGVRFLISLTALSLFLSPFWLIFAERCRSLAKNVDVASTWEFFQLAISREIMKMESCKVRLITFISHFRHPNGKLSKIAQHLTRKIKSQPQEECKIPPLKESENPETTSDPSLKS